MRNASASRIVAAEMFPLNLPYQRKITWASLSETAAPMALLRLETEDGAVGVGEVTTKLQWSGTTFELIGMAIKQIFLPMLEGFDALDVEGFTQRADAIPENRFAKTLVENTLWDLRAACGGLPFWASWESPPSVPVSWLLSRQKPELMAEEASQMHSRYGFTTMKLKGGQGVETDIRAIRAVRRALPQDARIFVDANGHYDVAAAPDYIAALSAEGVCAVEDPYPLAPDAEFERIQRTSEIPVVIDAYGASLRNVRMFCDLGARAFAVKPGFIGLSESLRIARYASGQGAAVHVGIGGESEIGSLAALASTARLTSPSAWLPSETSFFLLLTERVVAEPIRITGGRATLPESPSIAGIVDWERVARLPRLNPSQRANEPLSKSERKSR